MIDRIHRSTVVVGGETVGAPKPAVAPVDRIPRAIILREYNEMQHNGLPPAAIVGVLKHRYGLSVLEMFVDPETGIARIKEAR